MNEIGIFNETDYKLEELDEVKPFLEFALSYMSLEKLEFNVIFVSDLRIHEINKQYRNIDRSTDVISFALEDYEDIRYTDFRLLGDIYISVDTAIKQATEYGHALLREVLFLTIHGFLHLLGFDHMNEEDEKVMFQKQEEILDVYKER